MKSERQKRLLGLEITLYMLFLYGTTACVFLNGDDFMYGAFSINGIVKSVASYYITGNGRFWINILDSAMLSFDRYLFIAVTPLIIMLFLILLAKNIQWITEKKTDYQKERKYIQYCMVLFACLDVLCLRETVFWITGMMNYLFPATVFLLAFLLFQHLHSNCNVSLAKRFLYYFICLLAGSSVEQFALMFVGLMTLIISADLFSKRTVSKVLLIGYLCAVIGLGVLLLAPGNFVRVDAQSKIMPAFVDNLWTLVYQDTMSPVAFPYLLMLSMCGSAFICKSSQSKWIRTYSILVPVLMVAIRCFPMIEKAVLITGLLIFLIAQMIYIFFCQNYPGKPTILSLAFVGIGSQIMLLISAIWGFRCMFSLYLIYMLLILFCLPKLDSEMRALVLCSGIVCSLSPVALAVLWFMRFLMKKRKRSLLIVWNTLTRISVVIAMAILLLGYAGNVPTHIRNIEQTERNADHGEIRLQELPNDIYSWYFIPMGEFHENYYRVYHSISDSVVIHYERTKQIP